MYGAILGDIIGSPYEFDRGSKAKDFPLFSENSTFTDDTVMTCAVAKAILDSKPDHSDLGEMAVRDMRQLGRTFKGRGYGGRFRRWLTCSEPHPYNSCGNGSAMRVSAIGYAAHSIDEAVAMSKAVTEITHNHPEGILGAEATAVCVWLARNGISKETIRDYVRDHYYPLGFTLDEIREEYKFNELARFTVPQAIEAFLEANSYEETIRLAITLGGDSDTLAAIAGGITGAYYGVPEDLRKQAIFFLPSELLTIINDFNDFVQKGGLNA